MTDSKLFMPFTRIKKKENRYTYLFWGVFFNLCVAFFCRIFKNWVDYFLVFKLDFIHFIIAIVYIIILAYLHKMEEQKRIKYNLMVYLLIAIPLILLILYIVVPTILWLNQ